jgi:hypothetical protein
LTKPTHPRLAVLFEDTKHPLPDVFALTFQSKDPGRHKSQTNVKQDAGPVTITTKRVWSNKISYVIDGIEYRRVYKTDIGVRPGTGRTNHICSFKKGTYVEFLLKQSL